ncbi:S ribonuclease [Pyrus ussuriensis x Pyrus communis]|uniref:S ribonuclease n=1 Tax=Pyrus ussuriensis x Pyrus communis TaxID=2448454 RepID=A0A5N5FIL6_9ROSA|nr:S ribonuclease [Pyrus ussuriensis x Pyrus communis]
MSSSDCKSDEYPSPLYRQGGSSSKVGYFKAVHVKINSDELFRNFFEVYKHAIPSGVRVKRVKDDSGHELYGEGFTFPMLRLFHEVIYSMKCTPAQCSPNAIHAMVGFSNLSSKGDHEWAKDTLEVSRDPLHWDKYGLPLKEEIKQIKDDALARPITVVKPAANDGGKKRYSSLACEPSAEKKPMTSFAARGSSFAAKKLVVDLTSPKRAKKTIEPKLAQRKASRLSRAKSGSAFKRLAVMKSGKEDSATQVAPGPRSTESEAEEFPEVCALLKADLLEDVDPCTKFVDSVGKAVIRSDSFTKRPTYSRRSFLIATMHKTLILTVECIRVNQDVVKCANEVEVALVAQLRSTTENIEKLESELVVLKGSNVYAPTCLQLDIAQQEVTHLDVRLSATQAILEAAEKEVSRVSPVVKYLERVNSELRSACFAKDEELIFIHAEVFRLKKVTSKLESKEMDLQGALSTSENLKKELDELQGAHARLVKENVQLKNEKVGHEVALASCQADFYKVRYVDHLQGKPSNYEFSEKNFKSFSIFPVDLLDFSFKAAFDRAAESQLMEALAAGSDAAAEGVVVEEPVVVQVANETNGLVGCFSETVDHLSPLRF